MVNVIELPLLLCHNCDQYFVKKSKEITINKVFMLVVSVKRQNAHFQALFANESLANNARHKYLNDPACKKAFMDTRIEPYEVHTDLSILDICQKVDETQSPRTDDMVSVATKFNAYVCKKCGHKITPTSNEYARNKARENT